MAAIFRNRQREINAKIFVACESVTFCYAAGVQTEASVAQSGRASRCQRECRGFKSLRSLHFFLQPRFERRLRWVKCSSRYLS